jgi:aminoglycoside phosphotransferase (APT) family kinase protein
VMSGGVNRVVRRDGTVIRPMGEYSPAVQRVLRHLEAVGFSGVPRVVSVDERERTETLTFLEGETSDYPLSANFRTDEAMMSAARFLARLHDALATFEAPENAVWWRPASPPVETIAHGDFAPYNCVIRNGQVAGVFDFDVAHPASRVSDLAYAAYRWVPLAAVPNPDGFGTPTDQVRRLVLFCAAYGAVDLAEVIDHAHRRLLVMADDIRRRAAGGNAAFQRHLDAGHDALYLNDAAHLRENRTLLITGSP